MDPNTIALIAVGGVGLAAIAVLTLVTLSASKRAAASDEALTSAREDLRSAELELERARAEAGQLDSVRQELTTERQMRGEAERQIERLSAQMREREQSVEAERKRLTQLSQEMQDRFKTLAGEALDASTAKLMEQAKETFTNNTKLAEGGVKSLVDPMHEQLKAVKEQVEKLEKDRVSSAGQLKEQINQLAIGLQRQTKETEGLVNALRHSPTTRGRMGESAVEKILEMAGLTKGMSFDTQVSFDGETGKVRPDAVVYLPGGGNLIIDSKVAFNAFHDASQLPEGTERTAALKRHADAVRQHVKDLAKTDYISQIDGAIEFTAMFTPNENFYALALEIDPDLYDFSIRNNVIIVTPTTLLALTKAVSYGWRQQSLEEGAREIGRLGAELYNRVAAFSEHMRLMGKSLDNATEKYNKAVGSLERNVLPQARKFRDLDGVSSNKPVHQLDVVETQARALTGPDWARKKDIEGDSED